MAVVLEFFFLHLRDDEASPVALCDEDPMLDEILVEPGRIEEWPGLHLAVRGGGLTDYLANDVGVRLCSTRLRSAIIGAAGNAEAIQWLPAEVVDEGGKSHEYHVLHFQDLPDVLNPRLTIRSRGWFVVKPVVSQALVGRCQIFSFPGGGTRTIVSKPVRRAIEEAECTGVDFSRVSVVEM